MKKLLTLITITSILLSTKQVAFAEEKNHSVDFGASLVGSQIKYLNSQILANKDVFGRFSYGFVLFRKEGQANYMPANIDGSVGLDLEIGLNDYLKRFDNVNKKIQGGYYAKYFGGLSYAMGNQNFSYPYLGIGLGVGASSNGMGFSTGFDIGTTLQSTEKIYFGGVLFIRPELNLKFSF